MAMTMPRPCGEPPLRSARGDVRPTRERPDLGLGMPDLAVHAVIGHIHSLRRPLDRGPIVWAAVVLR
ncbi:hypothetical protein E2562_026802 [Oryza meyeriana var. granulata]|uniref:Uncharacterized protein n=1 Tax=Oryza meyeriana var. granulata TaxID=110450 RepID=A0A6G1CIT3_9ORYZ|nr:hypothetical protein E2562_026802 [Oryza meyeriana var. granulata]